MFSSDSFLIFLLFFMTFLLLPSKSPSSSELWEEEEHLGALLASSTFI